MPSSSVLGSAGSVGSAGAAGSASRLASSARPSASVSMRRQLAGGGGRLAGLDHGELHVARAASPSCWSTATCTSSTLPTSSASVPGRACRASALPGSGPWSSSYGELDPVRPGAVGRGCGPRRSVVVGGDARRRASQVTPTAPYPVTCSGRADDLGGRAERADLGARGQASVATVPLGPLRCPWPRSAGTRRPRPRPGRSAP